MKIRNYTLNFSAKLPPIVTTPNALRVGATRFHQSFFSDGLPALPDPHTYIRTEVFYQFF